MTPFKKKRSIFSNRMVWFKNRYELRDVRNQHISISTNREQTRINVPISTFIPILMMINDAFIMDDLKYVKPEVIVLFYRHESRTLKETQTLQKVCGCIRKNIINK